MANPRVIKTSSKLKVPLSAQPAPPARHAPTSTGAPPRSTLQPGLVVLGVVALLALWVAAGGTLGGGGDVLAWVSFAALYLALLAIAVSPALSPGLTVGSSFLLALGAAAAVPIVALVGDTLGAVHMENSVVIVSSVAATIAALTSPIVRRSMVAPAPAAADPPAATSDGVGRYALVKRVGVGGMGEVWLAEHDTLARPAALKIIKRAKLDDSQREQEALDRFRQEAQVTAQLTSPHTIELYDFGVTEDGALYYAMELLDGMNLRTLVEEFGPLQDERVAFLLRQACHSLIEAHDAGLVHRDLKPENLFVARRGRDADFLKVLDFGLVKELGASGKIQRRSPRRQLTMAGARPGTPGFMAPEQIQDAQAIDQRADVYALGCVAYFAVTGSLVFEGSVDGQILFAHVEVDPDPPSVRLGRPVHPGVEALILRCLAKDANQRPSMEELDDALKALAFDPPWSQARARQWWETARNQRKTRGMRIPVVAGTTGRSRPK